MIAKRVFDLTLTTIVLVLLCPLLVISFIVIKFSLKGPALFVQRRAGYKGKIFKLYKFRTMSNEKDADGNLLPDEERLTSFGKTLRTLSIDELPGLYNVLRGDMSLVGPRPLLVEYLEKYNEDQKRRLDVLPGITGWAQVNGRNSISWTEKFKLDVWYVDNRSFFLDIKIILMTVFKVLKAKDIFHDGDKAMPFFRGSDEK